MTDNDYSTEDLNCGIGIYPFTHKPRVAIIGAGIAGLTAAWLLARAHFEVQIYEANRRIGGRIRTLRDGFSHPLYAEAGAMRIPEQHVLTLELCKIAKLDHALCDFEDEQHGKNALVWVNGTRYTREEYESGRSDLRAPYTRGVTSKQLLQNIVKRVALSSTINRDTISLGDYLRTLMARQSEMPERRLRSEDADIKITTGDIDLIRLEYGSTLLKASLGEALRELEMFSTSRKFQILGGMDLLPQQFVNCSIPESDSGVRLSRFIRLNCRVLEVSHSHGNRYKVFYEHSITKSQAHDDDFDYVVLAAPFSSLVHVDLNFLSHKRLHAIRNLHYETATKIVLEFSERFWELSKPKIVGGWSVTDLPIRWVHYPCRSQSPEPPDTRGLLLASYTLGEDSLRWGSLSPGDRLRFALRDIAQLHGIQLSKLERIWVGGMSHSWGQDEYSFGAFSILEPYQEREFFPYIQSPEQRIHFAGEHTSLKHGWIEGAIESGIRVAKEIWSDSKNRTAL